jgi:hypothetical protein
MVIPPAGSPRTGSGFLPATLSASTTLGTPVRRSCSPRGRTRSSSRSSWATPPWLTLDTHPYVMPGMGDQATRAMQDALYPGTKPFSEEGAGLVSGWCQKGPKRSGPLPLLLPSPDKHGV